MTHIWALVVDDCIPIRPGPPYWFRSKDQAYRFAKDSLLIYPHHQRLIPARFQIWHSGMCSFNQDTYNGNVIILKIDHTWYAVQYIDSIDPNAERLWKCQLLPMT